MILQQFAGKVEAGKIKIQEKGKFEMFLSLLEGKDIVVRIGEKKRIRTTGRPDEASNQNGWYWDCIVEIPANHIGYTKQEMHDAYGILFRKRENQCKPATVQSTTAMNTKEFAEYCEHCRRWAAEQGFVIPDPDKYKELSSIQ